MLWRWTSMWCNTNQSSASCGSKWTSCGDSLQPMLVHQPFFLPSAAPSPVHRPRPSQQRRARAVEEAHVSHTQSRATSVGLNPRAALAGSESFVGANRRLRAQHSGRASEMTGSPNGRSHASSPLTRPLDRMLCHSIGRILTHSWEHAWHPIAHLRICAPLLCWRVHAHAQHTSPLRCPPCDDARSPDPSFGTHACATHSSTASPALR